MAARNSLIEMIDWLVATKGLHAGAGLCRCQRGLRPAHRQCRGRAELCGLHDLPTNIFARNSVWHKIEGLEVAARPCRREFLRKAAAGAAANFFVATLPMASGASTAGATCSS